MNTNERNPTTQREHNIHTSLFIHEIGDLHSVDGIDREICRDERLQNVPRHEHRALAVGQEDADPILGGAPRATLTREDRTTRVVLQRDRTRLAISLIEELQELPLAILHFGLGGPGGEVETVGNADAVEGLADRSGVFAAVLQSRISR